MGVNYKGAITEFNPYVSQIPTDAYVKVGMYKQQQEELGIQKIQASIDQVAGLDVANTGGKKYLNERVNELTNTLNKYGHVDLSKVDNVRGLQGLASPIYQDMNIIKDVANTMQYRQLVKDQQDAIKAGKAEGFSVDYETNEKVVPWLNSDVAGENYSGGSSTLRGTMDEVKKKYEDAINKFKANKTSGSDIVGEGGMYQVDQTTTSLDEERLKRYILSTMTADEQELLKRSGWSKFRGLNDDGLKVLSTNLYTQLAIREDGKAARYNTEARLLPEGADKEALLSNAKAYAESAAQYRKTISQTNSVQKFNKADRESLYTGIETNLFADGISSALSYTEIERKKGINEVWKTTITENGLNQRNEADNNNARILELLKDNQIIYDGVDEHGNIKYKQNPDWVYVPKNSGKDGSGTGTGGTGKKGNNPTDETLTVATATDKTTTNINFETIDEVTNNLQASQMASQKEMNEYLYQNGFEDLFMPERAAMSTPGGVTDSKVLVVNPDKVGLHQQVLNKLTEVVDMVASRQEIPYSKPGYEVSSADTPGDRLFKERFRKAQLDNYLSNPKLAKIVSMQTEMNLTKSNWAAAIKDEAIKNAANPARRKEIESMSDEQVLDYWNKKEREADTTDLRNSSSHPSAHEYFSEDEVKLINKGLYAKSTANESRIITALSDIQVKNNGELVSVQSAIFNKLFPPSSEKRRSINPESIKITGVSIDRKSDNLSQFDPKITVNYAVSADGDNKGGFETVTISVKDIVDNNADNNVIKNLFRVAKYGPQDLAARYAAGINDNTLTKEGKPDKSKYMLLTSQNKDAGYFRIRYIGQDAQRQTGMIAPGGTAEPVTDDKGNVSYKTQGDLLQGNSLESGKAYIEQLIPDGKGNFTRVIIREPNSEKFKGFSSWANARLYLEDVYENSPYWGQYHEAIFNKKKN